MYVDRVPTYSATYCHLLFLKREGYNVWTSEIIADYDDGYYGGDGRDYTGALSHLVFDSNNIPHIIFSDIASTHWPGTQRLNVGNIRYGILDNGTWNFTTVYRQPLPTGFFNAIEMFGMCLLIQENTGMIRVIGEELVVNSETDYSCELVDIVIESGQGVGDLRPEYPHLLSNYPNPVDQLTTIRYSIPRHNTIHLSIYDINGRRITTLFEGMQTVEHGTITWDSTDYPAGVYVCALSAGDKIVTNHMTVIR
jgi:hypothetical protein